MIYFIRFVKANWLYGKASSKMKKGKYDEAIDILKMVLELEKKDDIATAIPMFDLGYCYYRCNNQNEALCWFSKSYEIYRNNSKKLQSEPFYQLLVHYSYLLKEKGDNDLAAVITTEAKKIKERLEGQ